MIIIGSGPAGYTAALYTARANLSPLVIEGFAWGGLLQQTTDVENYPGYPRGIMGPEMMQELRDQAERFGTRFITDDATRVELTDGGMQTVWIGDEAHRAKAVVLAMGAQHKKLGVPGEEELSGRGVSYCATCDAAFFKEHETIIVGGGDSAMEEAIFLAKFAAKVTSSTAATSSAPRRSCSTARRAAENIEFLTPYVVEEFVAGENGALATRARAQRRDRRDARACRRPARSSRSATSRSRSWSPARSSSTTNGYVKTDGHVDADERSRACSPPATSSTTPTARRSPPPAPAARPRSTPSGTCATRRRTWRRARRRRRSRRRGRRWPRPAARGRERTLKSISSVGSTASAACSEPASAATSSSRSCSADEVAVVEPVEADALDEAEPALERGAQGGGGLGLVRDALGDQAQELRAVAVADRAHLGVGAEAGEVERAEAVGRLVDEREVGVERAAQALGGRQRRVGLGEREQLVRLGADRREVEAALALEVVVEEALRDARGGGDVVDRELVVGVPGEQLATDREQLARRSATGAAECVLTSVQGARLSYSP